MTTPLLALPPSALAAAKKKRVLLVDASHAKRDLRAEVMRKLGIDVDCAVDIGEARSFWRADLYDLVLINADSGRGHRESFCEDIRGAKPPQRLAFLVGKPEYLADSPSADEGLPGQYATANHTVVGDVKAALSVDLGDLTQRWGILEASRRISAVRSACSARTRAMRDRPVPPRDSEGQPSRRTSRSATLDDLLRKELQ